MIEIRPATPADAGALAALRWEFRAGRGAAVEREPEFVGRCASWMRRQLEAAEPWRAWVAADDRGIVGQVWLMVFAKVPNPVGEPDRHAYLSNLYVSPAARGGVGERLVSAALAHADSIGVDRVVLWPTPESVPLYERHRFTREGDVMERSMPPPPAEPPRR